MKGPLHEQDTVHIVALCQLGRHGQLLRHRWVEPRGHSQKLMNKMLSQKIVRVRQIAFAGTTPKFVRWCEITPPANSRALGGGDA